MLDIGSNSSIIDWYWVEFFWFTSEVACSWIFKGSIDLFISSSSQDLDEDV